MNGIKSDFPILRSGSYLDNAATTQKPKSVIKALVDYYEQYNSNIHRGAYGIAEKASAAYESIRSKVATFINALDPCEIVFTSGTTEGINFVASALEDSISKGDEIVLTRIEHHSNFLPWQKLANKQDASIKYIPLTNDFKVDWEGVLNPKVKFVAISMESNVFGPIWDQEDLKKFIKKAHEYGALVLLDAAQSVPHGNLDIQALGADFVVFSGHKMLAPTGVGVLYIKKDIGESIEPYKLGGSMVYSVSYDHSKWDKIPHKFEAGTPNISGVIGLGAAIDYLNNIDFDLLREHEAKLCTKLIDGLEKIGSIRILGNKDRIKNRGHLVSFIMDGVHAHDLAEYLNNKGLCLRAGHHCVQPAHNLLGIDASIRASFYIYNTEEDVDNLLQGLEEASSYFKGLHDELVSSRVDGSL